MATRWNSPVPNHNWITSFANVAMPPIIYGTAWKKERTTDLVLQAVLAGFRGIDTACQPKHYAEDLVGGALQQLQERGIRREELYVQTKFTPLSGHDPKRVPYDPLASLDDQVAQSFATSTKNLHTEVVDCLLLHSPLATHDLLMRAWRAMEHIQQTGGARQLGISNCYDLQGLMALYSEAHVKPAVVQNRFYQEAGYDLQLRRWCQERRIIYQSFWTLTANPDVLSSALVRGLAEKYHKTPAQVLFRGLNQCNIVPLTGTCSHQHMMEDLAIFEFELTVDELSHLKELLH